jgi:hypothetical protein
MMIRFGVAAIAATALMAVGVIAPAEAVPALEFGSASPAVAGQDLSAGWSFTTVNAITVVALDAYDAALSGVVRFYDSGGTVLASATVTNSDPTEGTPLAFHSHAISPITLAANTTYFITEDLPTGSALYLLASGIVTDPDITYGGPVANLIGTNPTSDATGGAYGQAFFGPNFDVAVPEPASLSLIGLGIAALGMIRRRKAA